MFEPREWQATALTEFNGHDKRPHCFFLSACPGAGKTEGALFLANEVRDEGDFIVCVSPTVNVKNGFAISAEREFELRLLDNIPAGRPRAYHGLTTTYQGLLKRIDVLEKYRVPFITIFDEVHHCNVGNRPDEAAAFGKAADRLAKISKYVFAMSGTPYRTMGVIPFLDECETNNWIFDYGYGQGIADKVVRPLTFEFDDTKWRATVKVKGKSNPFNGTASTVGENVIDSLKYRAMFDTKGDWLAKTILKINDDINGLRAAGDVDAAALFVCRGGDDPSNADGHAFAVARRIRELTGENVILVRSKDSDDPSGKIEDFKQGTGKFIVAIRMISEGVNIPRLRRLALVMNTTSVGLFMQMLGRIVRWENDLDEFQNAVVYLPELPWFKEWAKTIENLITKAKATVKKTEPNGDKPKDKEEVEVSTESKRGDESSVFRHEDIKFHRLYAAEVLGQRDHPMVDALAREISLKQQRSAAKDKATKYPEAVGREAGKTDEEKKAMYRELSDTKIKRIFYLLKGTKGELDFISQVHTTVSSELGVDGVQDLHNNYSWEKMRERHAIAEKWETELTKKPQ